MNTRIPLGGVKTTNALHCLHGTVSSSGHSLDGLAVVSDIVGSPEPRDVAQQFVQTIRAFKSSPTAISASLSSQDQYTSKGLKHDVGALLTKIREASPMIHQVRSFPHV